MPETTQKPFELYTNFIWNDSSDQVSCASPQNYTVPKLVDYFESLNQTWYTLRSKGLIDQLEKEGKDNEIQKVLSKSGHPRLRKRSPGVDVKEDSKSDLGEVNESKSEGDSTNDGILPELKYQYRKKKPNGKNKAKSFKNQPDQGLSTNYKTHWDFVKTWWKSGYSPEAKSPATSPEVSQILASPISPSRKLSFERELESCTLNPPMGPEISMFTPIDPIQYPPTFNSLEPTRRVRKNAYKPNTYPLPFKQPSTESTKLENDVFSPKTHRPLPQDIPSIPTMEERPVSGESKVHSTLGRFFKNADSPVREKSVKKKRSSFFRAKKVPSPHVDFDLTNTLRKFLNTGLNGEELVAQINFTQERYHKQHNPHHYQKPYTGHRMEELFDSSSDSDLANY